MGEKVGHSGDQTERLFKNLASDYQKVKQRLHISGVDTDGEPMLRNSSELFMVFEDYYHLFFPQGGSTVPQVLVTENCAEILNPSDADSSPDSVPTSIPSVLSNDQLPSHSLSTPSVSAPAVLRKTRPSSLSCRKQKRPTPHDDMKVMINLQNRQLQVERARLRVEKEKLKAQQGIQVELTAIRFALCHSAGLSVQTVYSEE